MCNFSVRCRRSGRESSLVCPAREERYRVQKEPCLTGTRTLAPCRRGRGGTGGKFGTHGGRRQQVRPAGTRRLRVPALRRSSGARRTPGTGATTNWSSAPVPTSALAAAGPQGRSPGAGAVSASRVPALVCVTRRAAIMGRKQAKREPKIKAIRARRPAGQISRAAPGDRKRKKKKYRRPVF